jgi:hypothetical protein
LELELEEERLRQIDVVLATQALEDDFDGIFAREVAERVVEILT